MVQLANYDVDIPKLDIHTTPILEHMVCIALVRVSVSFLGSHVSLPGPTPTSFNQQFNMKPHSQANMSLLQANKI